MTNQESLHYRMQMNVVYPLKLWVKSILKDKNQNAIKKKSVQRNSPRPQVHCGDIVLDAVSCQE